MVYASSGKYPPSSASTQNWLWVFRVGVGFLLLASLLFLLGFFTKMWYDNNTTHYGLWKVCTGAVCEDIDSDDLPSYRIATQAFQCLAFATYGLAPFLHYIFYCTKKEKGFGIRIRVFDITYGFGVMFHLGSVLIYGLEQSRPQHFAWSYEMTAASAAINGVGICIVAFARKRALHDFRFCFHKKKSRRSSRVAASSGAGGEGASRRRRRGFPNNRSLQQSSPTGSNNQLVFGPREKRQFQSTQVSNSSSPQPSVNVTVHNTIYTNSQEMSQQLQYQPFPFATQASASSGYPITQSQPSAFPYPPQTQAGSIPYTNHPQTIQAYPPQGQPLQPTAPSFSSHNTSHTLPPESSSTQNILPPLKGGIFNSSGVNDSVDSGKPPPYEDVLVKTPDNHYS